MKRAIVLVVLVACGALSVAISAYQQPAGAAQTPAPRVVEVEKLKDNLFVLRGMGGGGNTAVFVQANGITVVDTKNPGWGQPILDKIKELSNKPITRIINTHTHGDHVSGNVEFPTTVEIVVHESTKANMEQMRGPTGITPPAGAPPPTNIFKANNGRGMPTRTFKDTMSIDSGSDRIDLFYFGRGHTNGDAWVLFPSLRVVHAGDIFSGKNIPLLDANNGGTGVQIGDTLAKAADALGKSADTIITGHSVQMTFAELKEYAEFNREFAASVRDAKKAGKSVSEIAAAWKVPEKYKGYTAPAPQKDGSPAARVTANVQVVWDELK